ncbi:MAG: hypothetical protein ACM3ML_31475 [Micromonosporaceae bacterium]
MTTRLAPSHPRTVTGWPVRRTPVWLFVALAAFLAAAVLVGLAHRPTNSERATDLHAVIKTLNADIESCAGGLRDSLIAMRAIESGASHDRATALRIASLGAANCSPANNQLLADLTQYQVPESLARFKLEPTVDELVTWAFPWAQRAQQDVVNVLQARGADARDKASAALRADLRTLDSHRSAVDSALTRTAQVIGSTDRLPSLPG